MRKADSSVTRSNRGSSRSVRGIGGDRLTTARWLMFSASPWRGRLIVTAVPRVGLTGWGQTPIRNTIYGAQFGLRLISSTFTMRRPPIP
jgi:hypothetical protein